MKRELLRIVGLVLCIVFICGLAQAQSFNFNYQGKLDDAGAPANGIYDFRFRLFDISSGGTPLVTTDLEDVQVTNGVFSVELSFGASAFPANAFRVLEIAVRPGASVGAYTTLAPRQEILSAPYSIRSRYAINAETADNASQLGGIGAGGFLRNTSSPQSANFNILGSGLLSGTLGIGINTFVETPLRLDVKGRARFRQYSDDSGGTNSAGFWLFQNANSDVAFLGMKDELNFGVYGNFGGGWGLTTNIVTGNVGIGTDTPDATYRLDVDGRSRFKQKLGNTGVNNTAGFWLYQNSPAAERAFVGMQDDNNVGFYGNNGAAWGLVMNTITGNVGIGTAPNDKLEVNGFMRVNSLSGGGTTQLCRNGANQLSLCGSSLRYKTNIAPFFSGLSFIRQLRPITFDWIQDGTRDVGFGAEDVAKIDPLFVTHNDKGQIEGVKYDRISVVLVNAMKEQQEQIEIQAKTIRRQQREVDALRDVVCSLKPRAAGCKERR